MSRISGKDELRQLKSSLFCGDSGLSIALGFVAFIGAAHVLIRTAKYGMLPLGDAYIYTRFAGTLVAGEGFEGGLVMWPPLLPVVMAFFRLFGVGPYDAGRIVNIISIGLIVLVVGHLLHHHVRYRPIVIGALVTIIVSYPLARVSSYAMTETLFILITLLALVQMESFLNGRGGGGHKSVFLLCNWFISFGSVAPLARAHGDIHWSTYDSDEPKISGARQIEERRHLRIHVSAARRSLGDPQLDHKRNSDRVTVFREMWRGQMSSLGGSRARPVFPLLPSP